MGEASASLQADLFADPPASSETDLPDVIRVPDARMRRGTGDIPKAISCGKIISGSGSVVKVAGRRLCPTGGCSGGPSEYEQEHFSWVEACELVPLSDWSGTIYTYEQKGWLIKTDADRARFYEGVKIKTRQGEFILGRKVRIVGEGA